MKLGLYSIKDTLVGYTTPFCQFSDAVAIRGFATAAQDTTKNNVNTNPGDKELYLLGSFDDVSGEVIPLTSPKYLARATDFIKRVEQ